MAATFAIGHRVAGRFGVGHMSIAATQAKAFEVLARHWETTQEVASAHGTAVSPRGLATRRPHAHCSYRGAGPRRGAARPSRSGSTTSPRSAAVPILGDLDTSGDIVDAVNASGVGVVGTPEMAIEQLRRLENQSGGYGTYLLMAHDWADRRATLNSYDMFARYVMPEFQGTTRTLIDSRDWTIENRSDFIGNATSAIKQATDRYVVERNIRQAAASDGTSG